MLCGYVDIRSLSRLLYCRAYWSHAFIKIIVALKLLDMTWIKQWNNLWFFKKFSRECQKSTKHDDSASYFSCKSTIKHKRQVAKLMLVSHTFVLKIIFKTRDCAVCKGLLLKSLKSPKLYERIQQDKKL